MCGRFVLTTAGQALKEHFDASDPPQELRPRYNIAPSQEMTAVRTAGDQREIVALRWGLIPFWAKDPAIGARMINARSETAADKPSFRAAFRKRRCLVPADGFYEWQRTGSSKQPYFIHRRDGRPFGIAALWEQWTSPDGGLVESCALLTTTPNAVLEPVHNRMPVILEPPDYQTWLDTEHSDPEVLQDLLAPCNDELLEAYPVDAAVNNARHESAENIRRLAAPQAPRP